MSTTHIMETSHYITLRLGDELFAVDVTQVREVLDVTAITRVPTAPRYVRGVVNVRGTAIPLIDLRLKFGLPALADTVHTRIVVLEVEIDGEQTVVGGLADAVHDVIAIEPQNIDEPPRLGVRWRSELIKGLSKRGDDFVMILDINRVFASEDVALAAVRADDNTHAASAHA